MTKERDCKKDIQSNEGDVVSNVRITHVQDSLENRASSYFPVDVPRRLVDSIRELAAASI